MSRTSKSGRRGTDDSTAAPMLCFVICRGFDFLHLLDGGCSSAEEQLQEAQSKVITQLICMVEWRYRLYRKKQSCQGKTSTSTSANCNTFGSSFQCKISKSNAGEFKAPVGSAGYEKQDDIFTAGI